MPLYTSIGAFFVNVGANYIFIFGKLGIPKMGVAGAAWATIIGQAAAFLFACFYLYRSKEAFGFDFKPKSFKINKNYFYITYKTKTKIFNKL